MKEDRAAPRPAEGNTFFPCRVNICVAWGVGAACMWRSQIWRASIQHMIVELWACHAIVAAELGTSEGTACARGNQASDVITRVTRESLLHSFFFLFAKRHSGVTHSQTYLHVPALPHVVLSVKCLATLRRAWSTAPHTEIVVGSTRALQCLESNCGCEWRVCVVLHLERISSWRKGRKDFVCLFDIEISQCLSKSPGFLF
jgi:hypothetical protein